MNMITDEPDQSASFDFILRPNCLITRRPLVFLTPPRSIFWYKSPWQRIIHILVQHGYRAEAIQLPFQNIFSQKKILLQNLDRLSNSHIVVDSVTSRNLKSELEKIIDSTITTIAQFSSPESKNYYFPSCYKKKSLHYLLHRVWCRTLGIKTPSVSEVLEDCPEMTWHLFLDHCIHLAEIDFQKD